VERLAKDELRWTGEALARVEREHALDEAMVEERRARLEAVRHGAEVGLAQDVLGQVVGEIDREQRFARRLALLVRFAPVGRPLGERLALEEGALRRRKTGEAQRICILPVHDDLRGELALAQGPLDGGRQAQMPAPAAAQVLGDT